MTATLPIIEGGEVPIPFDPPKARARKTTRKRKVAAQPEPNLAMLDRPAQAIFAGVPVRVTAIGEKSVVVAHEQPLAAEGDLILRIPGLFAELSRLGGRVSTTSRGASTIEITRNAISLTFALDAARHPVEDTRPRLSVVSDTAPPPAEPRRPATTLLAPTRALPATFADARVALLEIEGTTMRVAHSKPLPLDGEHPFAIKTEVTDVFSSQAHVISWERLQESGDVYVSTIEITRNVVSFRCAIDELVRANLLQPKAAHAVIEDVPIIEPDPQPLPHPRDTRPPLVPIVRLQTAPAKTHRRWQPLAIALIALLVAITSIVGYVKRPDEHLVRAQKMIEAYEDGLMPSERDYSLPVYTNALRELAAVRPASISHDDAQQMTSRIRQLIASHRAHAVRGSVTAN